MFLLLPSEKDGVRGDIMFRIPPPTEKDGVRGYIMFLLLPQGEGWDEGI